MAEYSLSLNGKEWQDNERLVDWLCTRCSARFERKEDVQAHIGFEHNGGSYRPCLNVQGTKMAVMAVAVTKSEDPLRLAFLKQSGVIPHSAFAGEMSEEEAFKIVRDHESEILSQMGMRAGIVEPGEITPRASNREPTQLPSGWPHSVDETMPVEVQATESKGDPVRKDPQPGSPIHGMSHTPSRGEPINPTAFISYSWEDEANKAWTRELASRLRADGIDITLDQWETAPGDQLPAFMEREIRENSYVLIVCTPRYKERSDNREGGIGYEGDIMTAEQLTHQNERKFIPLLRRGTWQQAAPSWLLGKYYVDFRGDPYPKRSYDDLLTTIYGARPAAPSLGPVPERFRQSAPENAMTATAGASTHDIKIKGIIVDEVTEPAADNTRGSALYQVPFQLSRTPSAEWASMFVETWDHPSRFTTMHRPGIAAVHGDRIVLDGTTVEEVEEYHRDTLVLVVRRVNEMMAEREVQQQKEEEVRLLRSQEHRKHVAQVSKRIEFD